ncbi:hypothetical protein GPJ56_005795 [Histomonas meleagridis]|uniref:uncharacterized protein n=1 Tax=Histomonas meleagridis TaxID=135588 RepID=UPI00355A1CC1|nr:hypothetical protein GPJ56_005795 [Histomonas meleagridis]KAH0798669.1 hypothetical protein GO595_008534 [Histomonas meleagridis]
MDENNFIPSGGFFNVTEHSFLETSCSFVTDNVFENEDINIIVDITNLIPKFIPHCKFCVRLTSLNTKKDTNDKNIILIDNEYDICSYQRLRIHHSFRLSDCQDYCVDSIGLVLNNFTLFFPNLTFSKLALKTKRNDCILTTNLPPVGIVYIATPIKLIFNTGDEKDYDIIITFHCSKGIITFSKDKSDVLQTHILHISEAHTIYEYDFFVHCYIPGQNTINVEWFIRRDSKDLYFTRQDLPLEFVCPFVLRNSIYDMYHSIVYNESYKEIHSLHTSSDYYLFNEFKMNIGWKVNILSFEIQSKNDVVNYIDTFIELPFELESNDEFSVMNKFHINGTKLNNIDLGNIIITYNIDSDNYLGTHKYIISLPNVPVVEQEIIVKLDFPSSGSQFEMCEMFLELTNVSKFPIEAVFEICNSQHFAIFGIMNTQICLIPQQPLKVSIRFFPLTHGNLAFPTISLTAANNLKKCFWNSSPSLFVSYSTAS